MASIPLTSICEVKRFSKRNLPKGKQMFLMDGFEIICSSIQSHRVRKHTFYLFSSLNFIYRAFFGNGVIWTMSILVQINQRCGKEQPMQRCNWGNFCKVELSQPLSCWADSCFAKNFCWFFVDNYKPVCCLYAQLCIFFSFASALRAPWTLILSWKLLLETQKL